MQAGAPAALTGVPRRPAQENDAIPRVAPKWLKHDRHVLNFKAYFLEPVVEDPTENYRIRKCIIYFYLEDDTFHIIEPRVPNSGIPQGIFLKRSKLGKPDGSGDYDWPDFQLGMDLNVYNRVFRIIDCDEFTRSYYANEGLDIGTAEDYPDNPFEHARSMINMKQVPPDQAEFKNYIEVKLKGGRPNGGLKSFLDNDRRVLCFKILWQDVSYDGGDKFYTLNFFLSDNSVEVKEINTQNSGRTPFPKLLKRQKLAKNPILTHCPGMSLRTEEYYMPEDIRCGTPIKIYGRDCQIFDCDDFTKAWYVQNCGITQVPIQLPTSAPSVQYQPVPAYQGFGTEEDSMGSVVNLRPKVPKPNMKKMFKQDMHILRFNAKLVSTEPDDENREFIISFYCGDDTIQIYEVCDKNSGRIGGKFMEKKTHKNPVTNGNYEEKDLCIGRTLFLGGFRFQLASADEYTEKYMEDNPEQFPEQNINNILDKIKKKAVGYASMQDYCIDLLVKLDKNNDGVIDFEEFTAGLRM